MRSTILRTSLTALMITASSIAVMADEHGEILEKARLLKREAAVLSEKGHQEEAEKLALQSRELMEKAAQLVASRRDPHSFFHKPDLAGQNPDIQHLKERLMDLTVALQKAKESGAEQEAKEIAEQIAQTERKLKHLASLQDEHAEHRDVPVRFRPQAEKLAGAARRLNHVRVAAENLKAAEMHDMAHELMKKADAMEEDVRAAKMELARAIKGASHERGHSPDGDMVELRSENERLRRELNELREVVEQLRIKLERDEREPESDER